MLYVADVYIANPEVPNPANPDNRLWPVRR